VNPLPLAPLALAEGLGEGKPCEHKRRRLKRVVPLSLTLSPFGGEGTGFAIMRPVFTSPRP
jgi:hypothetical protein